MEQQNITEIPPVKAPETPSPKNTIEKYHNALNEMHTILSSTDGERSFVMSNFIKKHHLSGQFGPACVAMEFIRLKSKTVRNRHKYELIEIFGFNQGDADNVRKWISTKTNGRQPKSVRMSGSGQRHRRTGDDARNRTQIHPGGKTNGVIARADVANRIQSSFFNKLCPQCAETLHQIIDLLKS